MGIKSNLAFKAPLSVTPCIFFHYAVSITFSQQSCIYFHLALMSLKLVELDVRHNKMQEYLQNLRATSFVSKKRLQIPRDIILSVKITCRFFVLIVVVFLSQKISILLVKVVHLNAKVNSFEISTFTCYRSSILLLLDLPLYSA